VPSVIIRKQEHICIPCSTLPIIIIDLWAIPSRYFYSPRGGCRRADKSNEYGIVICEWNGCKKSTGAVQMCRLAVTYRKCGYAYRLHVACDNMEVDVVGDLCMSRLNSVLKMHAKKAERGVASGVYPDGYSAIRTRDHNILYYSICSLDFIKSSIFISLKFNFLNLTSEIGDVKEIIYR